MTAPAPAPQHDYRYHLLPGVNGEFVLAKTCMKCGKQVDANEPMIDWSPCVKNVCEKQTTLESD